MINDTELNTFAATTYKLMVESRQQLLQDQVAQLLGKTVKIERNLKDRISGDNHRMTLEATIIGARWAYEDDILLKVTYTHPFTGKTAETEEGI